MVAQEIATLRRFIIDQRGTTAIAYGIIGTFLSLAIIAGTRSIGANISANMFAPIANNLN
jgi:Flp pilus assembly pilin Flp